MNIKKIIIKILAELIILLNNVLICVCNTMNINYFLDLSKIVIDYLINSYEIIKKCPKYIDCFIKIKNYFNEIIKNYSYYKFECTNPISYYQLDNLFNIYCVPIECNTYNNIFFLSETFNLFEYIKIEIDIFNDELKRENRSKLSN